MTTAETTTELFESFSNAVLALTNVNRILFNLAAQHGDIDIKLLNDYEDLT